jgi:hypothetical protein
MTQEGFFTMAPMPDVLARTRPAWRSGEHAGVSTVPAGKWTYAHRHVLRISVMALIALIFVFWGQPTAAVIVLAVLRLVIPGLIELTGRPPWRCRRRQVSRDACRRPAANSVCGITLKRGCRRPLRGAESRS